MYKAFSWYVIQITQLPCVDQHVDDDWSLYLIIEQIISTLSMHQRVRVGNKIAYGAPGWHNT